MVSHRNKDMKITAYKSAQILGISRQAVSYRIKQGKFPAGSVEIVDGQKRVLFDIRDILDFKKAMELVR
jgi:predicted transcriptional regulator